MEDNREKGGFFSFFKKKNSGDGFSKSGEKESKGLRRSSKKTNPLDRDLKFPPEFAHSKKDICQKIREIFELPTNEGADEHFYYFTKLERIEEEVFGSLVGKEEEFKYFPLRLYVTHNTQDTFKKKIQGQKKLLSGFISNILFKKYIPQEDLQKLLRRLELPTLQSKLQIMFCIGSIQGIFLQKKTIKTPKKVSSDLESSS